MKHGNGAGINSLTSQLKYPILTFLHSLFSNWTTTDRLSDFSHFLCVCSFHHLSPFYFLLLLSYFNHVAASKPEAALPELSLLSVLFLLTSCHGIISLSPSVLSPMMVTVTVQFVLIHQYSVHFSLTISFSKQFSLSHLLTSFHFFICALSLPEFILPHIFYDKIGV